MSLEENIYEVAIIGAGVCGTALLYTLSNYTNINKIALIEKNEAAALVNSHKNSNSQTLHFGDIETNYTLEKAAKVNQAASLVKHYLLQQNTEQNIYTKYHKMVLAVGKEQAEELKKRYQEFRQLFPEIRLIEREEIEHLEPKVLEGRETTEEIIALYTPEGYTIDFQKLSQSFLDNSLNKNIDVFWKKKVTKIAKIGEFYHLEIENKKIVAKTVAIMAGAHSLLLAKSLGYGQEYALLSVAGSFYFAPAILKGKVYTVQLKTLPFAAIHGDPEVDDRNQTRFGPTAKVLPMLERHNYSSVWEYFQTAGLSLAAIKSFWNILADPVIFKYILRNFIYDLPFIGKRLFIQEVKKIIPSINLKDLKFAYKYGGIRPQIVNLTTQSLEMGEAKIKGDRIIFNITPSPGASTCLQNAQDDTERLIAFLGEEYQFDKERFLTDLGSKKAYC
jgi:malate dehydrogenase (quinone)